ncbi:hypothetical protein BH24BAC1_BH24BAC1_28550 [soil metagenome]|jgi:hypothetical protein
MKISHDKKTEKPVMDRLRDIRDDISLEIQDLNSEQLKEYLKKKEILHPTSPWRRKG